ncbi:MAG: FAD-dependent oxidoreductase [Thermodesulfobacteriota bacterium]
MKFVVIGGDAAGMSAASRAKRNAPDLGLVVLEQTTDVSYSACGMPYNLADPGRSIEDLVVRPAKVFIEKQGLDLRLGHKVERIDRTAKKVLGRTHAGDGFEVDYDKLCIATGARAIILDIPGAELPEVMGLKSLEDGRRIKAYLADHDVKRAVIIGAGYIGLEMTEAFHDRGIETTIVEALPRLLPWLPQGMSDLVAAELESKGVKLLVGTSPLAIERTDKGLAVAVGSERLPCDMVLMAVGVAPNSEIAAAAGLDLGPKRAIAVDRGLRTSDPNIYAAGDCADAFNVVSGRRVWVPLALRANRAGWAVADNVTGKDVQLPGIANTAVFKVLDMEVATTGLRVNDAGEAGFAPVEIVIQSRSRAHAHPGNQTIHICMLGDSKTGRLLGAQMVGREGVAHRINAVAVALHAGMTAEDFVQCDMAYAPPFSPVWDPLLTAGNQLLKKL